MDCARITSPEDFGDCRFGVGNILHPPYRPAISHCGGCTDSKAGTSDPSVLQKRQISPSGKAHFDVTLPHLGHTRTITILCQKLKRQTYPP
ncbi:hypothetical protein DSO57_1028253 [Entomophthora muscae]|uniref:Uncharacterized protein n=1 Tax=Entomophthora muscae TaxID=34485 RepID=A0ACC2UB37_9FUNG|nr:hypothetical protein DSO57_1028253 [Entomophthora muscae]